MHAIRLFVFFCIALANARQGYAQQPAFVFTGSPNRDDEELIKQFTPLASYLQSKLGVEAKYVPVHTYEDAVKLFVTGNVKLAWFGGYAAIKALRAVPSAKLVAQGYEDTSFKSYFIAHTSTGLQPSVDFPKAMQGKTLVFGSPTSTSGRLVGEYWIRRHLGQPPAQAFSRVSFSGDHASTLQLVQSGVADVGVLNYTVYEEAKKAGKVDETKVRVIWETPPFPDNAFVVYGDLDATYGQGFTRRLQQAILDISDAKLLKAFSRSRFVPAKTEQYEFLEEIAAQVEAEEKAKAKK
jgi:phosphonate transport system substrate-binding protein